MARKFAELEAKMSTAARARSDALYKRMSEALAKSEPTPADDKKRAPAPARQTNKTAR